FLAAADLESRGRPGGRGSECRSDAEDGRRKWRAENRRHLDCVLWISRDRPGWGNARSLRISAHQRTAGNRRDCRATRWTDSSRAGVAGLRRRDDRADHGPPAARVLYRVRLESWLCRGATRLSPALAWREALQLRAVRF